jgi:tetratricopeptide (TPR) repeat protein
MRNEVYRDEWTYWRAAVQDSDGRHPVGLYNLARVLHRHGASADALPFYRAAEAQLASDDRTLAVDKVRSSMAKALVLALDFPQAKSLREALVAARPEAIDGRVDLAASYAQLGDYARAQRELTTVLELSPRHEGAQQLLEGVASLRTVRESGAPQVPVAALAADAAAHLADAYGRIGDVATALRHWERVLAAADAAAADRVRAVGYMARYGDPLRALEAVRRARDSTNERAWASIEAMAEERAQLRARIDAELSPLKRYGRPNGDLGGPPR